jgi:uncharacterized protein YggU (UPF0235/DUF167 family)
VRVAVHVKPGARTTRVGGVAAGSLSVRVRAHAVDGAANEAVVVAVAVAFGLKPRQVTLIHGRTGRRKLLELDIADELGDRRLAELRSAATGSVPPL